MRNQHLQQLAQVVRRMEGRAEVARALCDALATIGDYDARTRSDLSRTLRVYIQSGGNLAATAEGLFLHRNSVMYRLQRIQELSAIDARDGPTRRLLLVAFALADPSVLEPEPVEEEDEA